MPYRISPIRMIAALFLSMAGGQMFPAEAGGTKTAFVIDGFQSPESVLIVGDRRFVSNIGQRLEPLAKDGDGYISEVSAEGKMIEARAFPPKGETLDAPKGMAALDGKLYVADIDSVIGFDIASGARVFTAKLPGTQPTLLNDLAVSPDGKLLVTDTLRNAVYRLDLANRAFEELTTEVPGANGIAVGADGRIAVVGLGANFSGGDVFRLSEAGRPVRFVAPNGLFDGVAMLPDGGLLISDWRAVDRPVPGAVLLVTEKGVDGINLDRDLHGPADFAFDPNNRVLWIPATRDNQVIVMRLTE